MSNFLKCDSSPDQPAMASPIKSRGLVLLSVKLVYEIDVNSERHKTRSDSAREMGWHEIGRPNGQRTWVVACA